VTAVVEQVKPSGARRFSLPAAGAAALILLFLLAGGVAGAACFKAETLFTIERGGGTPLRQPADLALHGERLFVLDDLNGRVAVFSLEGGYLSSVRLPGGSASSHLAIDVGSDDNIYLAASGKGKVVILSGKGKQLAAFITGSGEKPTEPVGIEVSRGQIFVADNEAHSVKVFDMDGNSVRSWGGTGEGPTSFRYPFRIIQDASGRVIVSDTLNSRIKIFTPAGDPLVEFGEFGVTEGTLYRPAGLAVWGEELLLVSDNYLGSVQAFALQGGYEASLCGADGVPVLFENPVSLAVRGSTLFVLEMGANRVRALRLRGK
jgi:hypothetical protein